MNVLFSGLLKAIAGFVISSNKSPKLRTKEYVHNLRRKLGFKGDQAALKLSHRYESHHMSLRREHALMSLINAEYPGLGVPLVGSYAQRKVYGNGDAREAACYMMEVLDKSLHRIGRVPQDVAAHHILEVAETLEQLHDGLLVYHGDIKPANVMLTPSGKAVISDFGSALPKYRKRSEHGKLFLTPAFMSPEQAGGNPRMIDQRTDLYSLGVSLFYLLTGGELPRYFDLIDVHDSRQFVLKQKSCLTNAQDPIINLHHVDYVDADLHRIVEGLLQKDPGLRYSSAGGVVRDLRHYLSSKTVERTSH